MESPQTVRSRKPGLLARPFCRWAVSLLFLCAGPAVPGLRAQQTNTNNISRAELLANMDQMKELLSDVAALQIKCVGNKVVFDGKIKTQADLDKIKKVEAAYPGAVIDLTELDLIETANDLKTAILKDLRGAGLEAVNVEIAADTVVLNGVVTSDAEMTRCVDIAKLRAANVKSMLRVQEAMIETDLQFVEVDHDAASSFGQNLFNNSIVLTPSFSAANTGRPGLSLGATATYTVNSALTAANCKSIYQENISGASGQEVDFKQGGTVYVPSIAPVPFGVIVKVKPTLLGNGEILSDVSVEVSTALSNQGQVTTREFRTSTSVMSRIGDTVVLSGFAEALGTASTDKSPVLGDIPLLNLLFGRKSKSKVHKDAILLLTPRPSSLPEAATGPAFSVRSKALLNDAKSE
jgi:Flp pilus assembly secretin CpaC